MTPLEIEILLRELADMVAAGDATDAYIANLAREIHYHMNKDHG